MKAEEDHLWREAAKKHFSEAYNERDSIYTELCGLFARNMGNYGMNRLTPAGVLKCLRARDSDQLRFLGCHWRPSGNFLVERCGMSEEDIEHLAESIVGLGFVCRAISLLAEAIDRARKIPGFDSSHYAVLREGVFWKVAVSLVAGLEHLPEPDKLRSPNPQVEIVPWENGPVRAILSLYNRPSSGGDFGVPNTAVEAALRAADASGFTVTTRSVRTLIELIDLADSL